MRACSCVSCSVKVIVAGPCVGTVAVKRERSLAGRRSKKGTPSFLRLKVIICSAWFQPSVGEVVQAAPSLRS